VTKSRNLWGSAVLLLVLAALVLATSCSLRKIGGAASNPTQENLPAEFQRVGEVWQILKREHFDRERLDAAALSEGAIRGMLQAVGDPYASYLNATQYAVESQDLRGSFEGIGAEVAMRDGRVTIVAPIPGTPAERAGIQPGDVVLEIDGMSTAGVTLLEAVGKIRGRKGTEVRLLVLHRQSKEPVSITISRDVIPLDSVRFSMLADRIGHLRILNFTSTTNREVQEALEKSRDLGAVGLVLDLRNNPGGLLSAVVDVTSQFLDSGLVLYEIDAQGRRTDWKVKPGGKGRELPLVVLVNEFSASASEIMAGAIIDQGRGPVVGTTTFGKGSVNNLWPLKDGSGIYFTIARWFTPKGSLIEGKGITPDMVVETQPNGSTDVQLDRAIELVRKQTPQSG
jgi:carboxyl-terminal processing protease